MKTEEQIADYIPFGEEWKKEMNKFPKAALIEMLSKRGQEIERLKKEIEDKAVYTGNSLK